MSTPSTEKAFTLVELSIVIVIIGLIIGGVTAGVNLVHQANIRSTMSSVNSWELAVNTFKLEYGGLPGDITNATAYWGTESVAGGAGTINGNGNRQIDPIATEGMRFWEQLALAGLIKGTYYGSFYGADNYALGINMPSVGLGTYTLFFYQGLGYPLRFIYNKNIFSLEYVAPRDVFAIDTKLDDGAANTGKIVALDQAICAVGAIYTLTETSKNCMLQFSKF